MEIYENYPCLRAMDKDIEIATSIITNAFKAGCKLLTCGNGGSAADSEHISGELLKSFITTRPIDRDLEEKLLGLGMGKEEASALEKGYPVIPLVSLTSFSTAYSNDKNPALVFAQAVNALGREGDVLWAITTSGNSRNTLLAAIVAKAKGMKIIAMTGEDGGAIKEYADVTLRVPARETYRVQEYHLPVYHHICHEIEERLKK